MLRSPRAALPALATASMLVCGALTTAACSSAGETPGGESTTGGDPDASSSGGGDASLDAGSLDATVSPDATTGCRALAKAPPSVLLYDLRAGAFPDAGAPSVAVHVPAGFDPSNRPGLIVFFHGFDNCVANVVGSADTPCVDGGTPRVAMHLIEQLDATRVNALLVAVELEVDMATGNPGQLATPGDFRALLHELFTEHLDAVLGCPLDVGSLERIVLSSHSGGYWAAGSVLAQGGVPQIREVDLLDSLYGEQAVFDAWMKAGIKRFDPSRADGLRWMDVYTSGGGTAANSRSMAVTAQDWLDDAGLPASEVFDDTTDTLDAAAYAHPVLFKLSSLAHDEVPQYYVEHLARASGFATIP